MIVLGGCVTWFVAWCIVMAVAGSKLDTEAFYAVATIARGLIPLATCVVAGLDHFDSGTMPDRIRLPFVCAAFLLLCGCEASVHEAVWQIAAIEDKGKQELESLSTLNELIPYTTHEDASVRSSACRSIGEVYGGTKNSEIASKCASVLCERLDDYDETIVAKCVARALLKIGLPSGHPDADAIETKLRNAAKDLIKYDAARYAMDALSLIEDPSDETRDTLIECLNFVQESDARLWKDPVRHHSAAALSRFGSRARVALPDLRNALADTPSNRYAFDVIEDAIKTIEASPLE